MTTDYLQLGATAVVAIVAFKAIETIVKSLVPKNSKEIRQNDEIIRLQGKVELLQDKIETIKVKSELIQNKLDKIADNELVHIKADIISNKEANIDGHQQILLAIQRLELTLKK